MTDNALIIIEIVKDDQGKIKNINRQISASLADIALAQMYLAEFLSQRSAQLPDTTTEFPATNFLGAAINCAHDEKFKERTK